MRLREGSYQGSANQTVRNAERLVETEYQRYWQLRNVRSDGAGGYTADAFDPAYTFKLSTAQASQLKQANQWTDTDVAAYEQQHAGQVVEQVVRPTGLIDPVVEVRPATHQVDDVLQEIRIRVDINERVLITTLTKRMAEQLTDYLTENGVKVRYLHSDIDTVERVEILRDLRLGTFDVLVGINLLREGLDIPEVSLVAILDADKEGFLRAERSLIQTIGRAARNQNGHAILYADKITESMRKAMAETERRRNKQIAHNEAHGITPKTINKRVKELIDGVMSNAAKDDLKAAEALVKSMEGTEALSERDLGKRIKQLEKDMLEAARALEFEKAARLRDQLALLKEQVFGATGHDHIVPIQAARK